MTTGRIWTARGASPAVTFDWTAAAALRTAVIDQVGFLNDLRSDERTAALRAHEDWTGTARTWFDGERGQLRTLISTAIDDLAQMLLDVDSAVGAADDVQADWNARFLAWSDGCDLAELVPMAAPPHPTYPYPPRTGPR